MEANGVLSAIYDPDNRAIRISGSGGTGTTSLDGLTDVTISAPADGDVLTYTAGTWQNAPAPSITVGSSPPSSPQTGDLWVDTT